MTAALARGAYPRASRSLASTFRSTSESGWCSDAGDLRGPTLLRARLRSSLAAVVAETDSVGRVHEERLRFRRRIATGGGITNVAEADVALQADHVTMLEDVAHENLSACA